MDYDVQTVLLHSIDESSPRDACAVVVLSAQIAVECTSNQHQPGPSGTNPCERVTDSSCGGDGGSGGSDSGGDSGGGGGSDDAHDADCPISGNAGEGGGGSGGGGSGSPSHCDGVTCRGSAMENINSDRSMLGRGRGLLDSRSHSRVLCLLAEINLMTGRLPSHCAQTQEQSTMVAPLPWDYITRWDFHET